MIPSDPHAGAPTLALGPPLAAAAAAVVMLHGRGASPESILTLADPIGRPDVAYLAPGAAGGAWYPRRFLEPIESNEPWLSSALATVGRLLAEVAAGGVPPERTVLLGFSQGACLALEYAARNARRYGGIVGLSGGLIGPAGTRFAYPGSLEGTPVFLGCSNVDAHIPLVRVEESAAALAALGGAVDKRIYPGMGHTVNDDEIAAIRQILTGAKTG